MAKAYITVRELDNGWLATYHPAQSPDGPHEFYSKDPHEALELALKSIAAEPAS